MYYKSDSLNNGLVQNVGRDLFLKMVRGARIPELELRFISRKFNFAPQDFSVWSYLLHETRAKSYKAIWSTMNLVAIVPLLNSILIFIFSNFVLKCKCKKRTCKEWVLQLTRVHYLLFKKDSKAIKFFRITLLHK